MQNPFREVRVNSSFEWSNYFRKLTMEGFRYSADSRFFLIFCLAELDRIYVIYMSHGGSVTVRLEPGQYDVKWFKPRREECSDAQIANVPFWTSLVAPGSSGWVILMESLSL